MAGSSASPRRNWATAWQAGDLPSAREAFEQVSRLDPENAGAAQGLMAVRFALGDYAGSAEAGERAVALLPDDYKVRFGLAALRVARRHLALGRTPEVLIAMAGAFANSGHPDSALVYLNEVEGLLTPADAGVQAAYAVGVTYEVAGERDRALPWFRSAFQRGFGREQAARSPWLADLRASPAYASLHSPGS